MAVIRANRESIDDRFSVLGFTVRTELPLFEVAIATDPELFRPANLARRTASNFFTSRLLRALPSQRGEAIYLVPPEVVARFVGQQRLYFALATYRESERRIPISLRLPDRGTMYVSLSGLTERGFRRSVRGRGPVASGYGGAGGELGWGGDAAPSAAPATPDDDPARRAASAAAPAPYSDGYSDELWKQPSAPVASQPGVQQPGVQQPGASAPVAQPSAPTAQGLGHRGRDRAAARSLLISSDYRPANFVDALRAQLGFFIDSARWYLGVANTTVMPHSAICQIRVPDGTEEGALHGSGFFIGPRLIMTAAHVVDGQSELIVVPGKNGGGVGTATEPFGRFRTRQFRKHDAYGVNGSDFDMALICVPAENKVGPGRYFDLVEELRESRPEGVVVTGYAARWYADDLIEHFVNATIDPNKQHMMGGYIRELPSDETFSYNIQTLGGTSGSPVYWIEDAASGPRAHMVGVHVAAHDETTNLGCRVTPDKLTWIRRIAAEWGQTLTFSAGAHALALSAAADEDGAHDIGGPIPDQVAGAQAWSGARGLTLSAPEYPQASRFEAAHSGNFRAVSGTRTIDRIVIHITDGGANINGTISWFKNPAAKVSAHYVIGQDGEIVQMVAHNDVAWHAGSANGTSIGIEHVANTRGLNPTAAQMCASAALVTWLCDTYGIPADRRHILGHAEADARTTHRACPNAVWDWAYYMDMITTRTCYEPASITPTTGLALGYGRALDAGAEEIDPDSIDNDHQLPEEVVAESQSVHALDDERADYPGASRFVPAHRNNYTARRRRDVPVDRIVIHITAGGPNINGTIAWFRNGNRVNSKGNPIRSSAHYIVGRDGEVVQMVRNAHTSHHASGSNWRSIGIEHNANKPYRLNRRDLPPTDPQYEASARLVAWLCRELGIPADRDHIKGHFEISPHDNHNCPTDYWDWERYMALVQAAYAAPPGSTAQGLAAGRGYASAQEIITPFYDPADPSSALTCQNDAFSLAREEWFAGVQNTRMFPHSAICLLEMDDGSGGTSFGTGFYIGRNRILTCAHNLSGKAQVTIVPGKNGAGTGTAEEPYGRCTVRSSSWRVAPRYGGAGDWDNDLAVIDNVPIAAPDGQWFEFLNATPSDRLPLVVCGYSRKSNAVPELTALMDGTKQHLHGGYARRMPTPDTIDYPILTLKRASGSPVYTLTGEGSNLSAKICAVHVSGEPASEGLNRGCFITPAKIDWIEGRAASFSLGASDRAVARPLEIPLDPGAGGRSIDVSALSPGDIIVSTARHPVSFAIRAGTLSSISHAMVYVGDGNVVEAVGSGVREVPVATAVSDAILAVAYRDPRVDAARAAAIVGYARAQVGKPYDYAGVARVGYRIAYPFRGRMLDKLRELTGLADDSATSFFCSELVFAAYENAGVPLLAARPDASSPEDLVALRSGLLQYVGHLIAHDEFLGIALGLSRPLAYGRALGNDGPSDHPVHLIPQPDKNACWAASMAMLLSYRRNASHTPESVARAVGSSLSTSYGWELLEAAQRRFGFETIRQPSNTSLYHTPRQWAEWLNTYGPLWVVIVGAPHAVVVAGIRGDLADPAKTQVKILNPWDTRVAFDNDPVAFRPANRGYEDWLPFADFASDFGNMAEPDYGNWRVLHLPQTAAQSQSLSTEAPALRLAAPPPPVRALDIAAAGERREPIDPSRVPGTRMSRVVGEAGACRWSLDQLEGLKSPAAPSMSVGSAAAAGDVRIALDDWPAIEGAPTPLPLTLEFRHRDGSVGDVRIAAGMPANLAYGVEVTAKIEDCADDGATARVRVRVDYRFRGLAQGNPDAVIELNLRGDGRYERENVWRNAGLLNPAA